MGWLQLVGSIKLQVSFTEYSLFYKALLQKRQIILRSLLTKATPYTYLSILIFLYISFYCYLSTLICLCVLFESYTSILNCPYSSISTSLCLRIFRFLSFFTYPFFFSVYTHPPIRVYPQFSVLLYLSIPIYRCLSFSTYLSILIVRIHLFECIYTNLLIAIIPKFTILPYLSIRIYPSVSFSTCISIFIFLYVPFDCYLCRYLSTYTYFSKIIFL